MSLYPKHCPLRRRRESEALFLPLALLGKDLHFVCLRSNFSTEEQRAGDETITQRKGPDTGEGCVRGAGGDTADTKDAVTPERHRQSFKLHLLHGCKHTQICP